MGDTSEDGLWFLPGPFDDLDQPPGAPPLPIADRRDLLDRDAWRSAQAELAADLAETTQLFGELDARLRGAPDGLKLRLALREAADLSWWTGDRVSADRLALWVGGHIGSTQDPEMALARSGWAVRRLSGGVPPSAGLAGFLGRREGAESVADAGALADLSDVLTSVTDLHPVVQAAVLFHTWRMIGPDRVRDGEAAVLAARHGASISRMPGQGALFLPLAMTGTAAFRGQGGARDKLRAWLKGAGQATLAALMEVDRLAQWRTRADNATADLSGRTPGLLLDVLASMPQVTAPSAEARTGASRAAIQRNIAKMMDRGLVYEITGQGRYRVWTARV